MVPTRVRTGSRVDVPYLDHAFLIRCLFGCFVGGTPVRVSVTTNAAGLVGSGSGCAVSGGGKVGRVAPVPVVGCPRFVPAVVVSILIVCLVVMLF